MGRFDAVTSPGPGPLPPSAPPSRADRSWRCVNGDWVVQRRQHLADLHFCALDVLVDVWTERGDPAQAVALATSMMGIDRLRERSCRRLIEANGLAGNAAGAQRALMR